MTIAEVQIHGYRKGHQLLASSVTLSKDDQSLLDRLSDVSGSLRPKEEFKPYLTAYPLPSGTYYVIARTWQDPSISRAGCVRTKSLLINAGLWARKPPLTAILHLLGSAELPIDGDAVSVQLEEQLKERFPPVLKFNADELLEALFLEEVKPVVVFDVPEPDLVALRILSALWPDIRRRFSLTTFALSPRKIDGRDLDLVFAPSSSRAKFSDWPGRRVDGRLSQSGRHKWTTALVGRVFLEPVPKLLSEREIELLGEHGTESTSALRIALLWEELLDKIDRTPTAILGLFDIANSGLVSNTAAIESLELRISGAIRKITVDLTANDAWDFVGAIVRKMQRFNMPESRTAVEQLASELAECAPAGALALLQKRDSKGAFIDLVPCIARGLGNGEASLVEQVLVDAPADIIVRLVSEDGALARRVAQDDILVEKIGLALENVDEELAINSGRALLPFLVEDKQLTAAVPIYNRLDGQEVIAEMHRLGDTTNFQGALLSAALIDRASAVDELKAVRDILVLSAAPNRMTLIERTIAPIPADVEWLLDEKRLPETSSAALLENVLRKADEKQFTALFSDKAKAERIIGSLPSNSIDIMTRALMDESLPIDLLMRTIKTLIPQVSETIRFEVSETALHRCLRTRFAGDELAELFFLLDIQGARLDSARAIQAGLTRAVDNEIVCRNLIAFDNAPIPARERILGSVDKMAYALQSRYSIALDQDSSAACARIMFDAERVSREALITAAGVLMPLLLRSRNMPVSLIIAALFPPIYRELAKADDVPDLLKFVPFIDWDRCKKARHELAKAFVSSSWPAGHLALTAALCGDIYRILEVVAQSYGGDRYLKKIENDLDRLSEGGRNEVIRSIMKIRSEE